ncbi:MAG: IS30 family transposase [Coriobacteriia bacterium]|nr:IS30 family transposase [Coriobacteriia bacterium]MCL2750435.1 IS30 family transposase [Coriobacteriia bacterium]
MAKGKKTYRRLDRNARDLIERNLNLGKSLSWIAKELNFSVSTVTREVKLHRTDGGIRRRTAAGNVANLCAHYKDCKKTGVCNICESAYHPRCATCKKVRCSNLCKDFVRLVCKTTTASPYVCNSCHKVTGCSLHKYYYRSADAQKVSDEEKVASRRGIDSDAATIEVVNELVRPLLAKGQSPGQIWLTHADNIPFSRRTFYRYNEQGLFGMTALELPRKAGYKRRRKKPKETSLEVAEGHSYKDFLALPEELRHSAVEMDTIMGTKHDGGSILTLHLRRILFQIGIKLAVHDCTHAVSAIDWLESILEKKFTRVYGTGLCDRGFEFHNTDAFERSAVFEGTKRMQLYYCDARRSDQKASCERQHVEFRKIVPKGTSIDALGALELAEVFSHTNSTPRRSLFGMSPMELAMQVLPKEFFEELGLRLITPDEVVLSPKLLD